MSVKKWAEGNTSFPHIELRVAASEVLLLYGASVGNAANTSTEGFDERCRGKVHGGQADVVCEGAGALLVSPWPTSLASTAVVPCCLS